VLFPIIDGLGVFAPTELAGWEQIIRENFALRGLTLTNLELVGVKTTRIP